MKERIVVKVSVDLRGVRPENRPARLLKAVKAAGLPVTRIADRRAGGYALLTYLEMRNGNENAFYPVDRADLNAAEVFEREYVL